MPIHTIKSEDFSEVLSAIAGIERTETIVQIVPMPGGWAVLTNAKDKVEKR